MNDTVRRSPRVIVVGAGPVGLTAATAAVSKGFDTVLLEAEGADRTRPGSRAIFLHKDPIARIDSYAPGVADQIYEGSMLWTRNRYTFRGRTFFNREFRSSTKATRDYGASQAQRNTEVILTNWLTSRGLQIRWNSEVVRVEPSDAGVTLVLGDGETLEADYVIGADGARSAVRKSLGIEMDGVAGIGDYNVIVDVEELPDRPTPYECFFHYDYPPAGYRNLLIVPMEGSWRLGLTLKPDDDSKYLSSEAGVREWIPKVMDRRYADRITWISTYRYHQLVAKRYCDPHRRVLLAGEAAHLFAPWGGRGLNSGIIDACDAVDAIGLAWNASSRAQAYAAVDAFDKDRREAGILHREATQYALNLLAPSNWYGKAKRRVLGMLAPHVQKAAKVLASGPNAGYVNNRPGGKGVY